jgi:hypothetical protein
MRPKKRQSCGATWQLTASISKVLLAVIQVVGILRSLLLLQISVAVGHRAVKCEAGTALVEAESKVQIGS